MTKKATHDPKSKRKTLITHPPPFGAPPPQFFLKNLISPLPKEK